MKKAKKLVIILSVFSLLCGCAKSAEPTIESAKTSTESTTTQATAQVTEYIPSAKVPEELQTLLMGGFLSGTASETLKAIISDVVVEKEEYDLYRDLGIADSLAHLEEYGGVLLRVDADNDGIDDLFFWMDDGGSMGNSHFYLAKGNAEGYYEITESQETLSQEIAFVAFEGKNYLVETDFEYNRKAVNGFIVTCYEQGMVSDRICLEATVSTWESDIVSCNREYQTLATQYSELGKDGFHDNNMYDYRVDAGSGERFEKGAPGEPTMYYADINNDGTEEWYTKYIFYPSNISTSVYLTNDLYFPNAPDQAEYLTTYYDLQYVGMPLTFWVEQTTTDANQTKQIVCLLTYEGLHTNRIYGYLIEGESVTNVFEIEYNGQLDFESHTELEEQGMKG